MNFQMIAMLATAAIVLSATPAKAGLIHESTRRLPAISPIAIHLSDLMQVRPSLDEPLGQGHVFSDFIKTEQKQKFVDTTSRMKALLLDGDGRLLGLFVDRLFTGGDIVRPGFPDHDQIWLHDPTIDPYSEALTLGVAVLPEPAALVMFGTALAVLAAIRRRPRHPASENAVRTLKSGQS